MTSESITPGEGLNHATNLPVRPEARFSEPQAMSASDIGWEMLAAEAEPYWPIPKEYDDRLKGGEDTNPETKYFDIFALSDEEKKDLTERIRESDGIIRIFVHPYYALHEIHSQGQIDDLERIDGALHKILGYKKDERPPVIVMEGYQTIEELYNLIKGFNQDDIYIAPTFCGTSQPYPGEESLQFPIDKEKISSNWQEYIDLLTELGVEKILIGGQYLSVHSSQHMRTDDSRYSRCVGFAINILRKNFNLRISNATNYTRSEIRHLFASQSKQSGKPFQDNL